MQRAICMAVLLSASASAGAVDWKGRTGAGGFIGFNRYAVGDTPADFISNGVSVTHGLNPKLRVGADAGFFVVHTDGDERDGGGSATGFAVGPSASYDVMSKESGSLYLLTRPLNYLRVDEGSDGDADWELSLLTAGVGLEAMVSRDFSVAMEGEAFRFGLVHFRKTKTGIGALGFASARIMLRMYF